MEIWRKKNTSTYITFPLLSSTGANIAGAASLDSEYLHWSDLSVPCAFSDMGDEARSVADGIYVLGVAAAEINYQYTYIEVKSDIALTQNILIRTNVQDPSNIAYAPDAISIMSAIAHVQVDTTSAAISLASILTNVARFETSAAVGIASLLVNVARFETSAAVGIASTLANIGIMSSSVMRDVTSLVVGVTSMMISVKSALSNTIAINTAVLSAAVAVKSTWSNTISIGVQASSLLSNVNAVLDRQTSHMVATYSALSNTAALLVFEASIVSSVLALDVAAASILSNIAAITPSDPAATAQAVWEYTVSQCSTTGMAGEYLMDAGAAADPWATDLPGAYTGNNAGAIISAINIATVSVLSNIAAVDVGVQSMAANLLVFNASTAIGVASLIVGVTSLVVGVTSMMVAVKSTWSNTIAINTALLSVAVAVKSTWSNTIAILVADSSLLYNVANLFGVTALSSIADYVWDEILTGATHNIATSAGRVLRSVGGNEITAGTTVSALNNSIQLAATASSVNNFYDPAIILIDSGTGVGQSRRIIEYNGTTKVATVQREWRTIPAAGSTYIIFSDGGQITLNDGAVVAAGASTITLNNVAQDADDTYIGATIAILAGAGKGQTRVIEAYNGTTKVATLHAAWETQPAEGDAYVIVPSGRTIVAGMLDGVITTTAMDSTLDLTTAQKAAVNAEIVDALNVDTYAEPGQEAPAATASLVKKIGYLYKHWRNRKTVTSTAINIFADNATTVDQKIAHSDDATTYDKGEVGSGP